MVIDLKGLFENEGGCLKVEGEISPARLKEIDSFSFVPPVTLRGVISNRVGMVTMKYTVTAAVDDVCSRCLRKLNRVFSFDFEHILVREKYDENDDELILAEGECLDMDELGVSDLLPEMPSKLLCRRDCKGLCPICGADLNESDCGCSRQSDGS